MRHYRKKLERIFLASLAGFFIPEKSFAQTSIVICVPNTAYGLNAQGAGGAPACANDAFGYGSEQYLTNGGGQYNTAFGAMTLQNLTTGSENVAVGAYTLQTNQTGIRNTAVGYTALTLTNPDNSCATNSGSSNTAVGWSALASNTCGWQNTAIGESALKSNNEGSHNTAVGEDSLYNNTTGTGNTGIGESALYNNAGGAYNTANGYYALNLTTGNYNIALGANAGIKAEDGSGNVFIANDGKPSDEGVIRIGSSYRATNHGVTPDTQRSVYIAGITNSPISGNPVYVTDDGQLGILASSIRFKIGVENLSSDFTNKLNNLRPVSFLYQKNEKTGNNSIQYGLVAEEVAKVFPELVIFDNNGLPFSVRYNFLVPIMLHQMKIDHTEKARMSQEVAVLRRAASAQVDRIAALEERLVRLEKRLESSSSWVGEPNVR
jgi:hypothetical protein